MPVFPLSIFDPVHIGIDEFGEHVHVELAERNMLLGGEPGGGKSYAINLITAHGALSGDCRLVLIDGKQVELGLWRHCADRFVGPSMADATGRVHWLQQHDERPLRHGCWPPACARSPASRGTRLPRRHRRIRLLLRHRRQETEPEEFAALARDLVARGRAAGVIVILATQRPSHQVIDPSLRDLFGYRWAFRCTTDSSSDAVLGHGWAGAGLHRRRPSTRSPAAWPGCCPKPASPGAIKTAYLTDDHIKPTSPRYAAQLRGRKDAA